MKLRNGNKLLALLLAMVMILSLLPGTALAASPADELTATVEGYYQKSENYVLEDWQELEAVYAYQAGKNYGGSVDLSAYDMSKIAITNDAPGVFVALMKGDLEAAKTAANSLVSNGNLRKATDAFAQASNMLALEAYNRSTDADITYEISHAVTDLLSFKNDDHQFLDYGAVSYDNAAMSLIALSEYKTGEGFTYQNDITNILTALKEKRNPNGTFSSWGAANANTTAVVCWALNALKDTDSSTITNALLNFFIPSGGFGYSDNSKVDAYATKQATIALAEQVSNTSFFKSIQLNQNHYTKTVKLQVVDEKNGFLEKAVSLTDTNTLNDAVRLVLGPSVTDGDYRYFKNSAATDAVSDGDTILAVNKKFTDVAYFSYEGSGVGVPSPTVAFGDSATLKLQQFSTDAPLNNIPVDVNGDTYGDVSSGTDGSISVKPLNAKTTLKVIKSDYNGNYVGDTIAVLPAYITMSPASSAQTRTVSVRVEGLTENIIHYSAVDVTGDGTRFLTVYDAVTQALTAKGIDYVANNGYISSIGGQKAGAGGGWDGWCYLLNGVTAGGMASKSIKNGDDILVYYGYSPGYGTDRVSLSSALTNGILTLTVTKQTTPVSGVTVHWDGTDLGTTNESGQIIVPADKAVVGAHTVQISMVDEKNIPTIIRFAPNTKVTISTTGSSQENGTGAVSTAKTVSVTVTGPSSTLASTSTKAWYIGMTALDALKATGLTITCDGNYVKGINGIKEFDYGPNSGWKYKVNGLIPALASSDYVLKENDTVQWYYISDYTHDSDYDSSWKNTGLSQSVAVVDGQVKATISEKDITGALAGGKKEIVIAPEVKGQVDTVAVSLPTNAIGKAADAGSSISVQTDVGVISIPSNALASVAKQASGNEIEITVQRKTEKQIDSLISSNAVSAKEAAGAVVIQVSIKSGKDSITSFDKNEISLTLPVDSSYKEGSSYKVIVVSDNGKVETFVCKVTSKNGNPTVELKLNHLTTFVITHTQATKFTDVSAGAWYYDAIAYAENKGLMNGTDNITFSPDANMTRAMLVTVLYRQEGSPAVAATNSFTDVASSQWHTSAVIWANANGIVTGYGDGIFGTDDNITRQQLATILYRYAKYKGYDVSKTTNLNAYTDANKIADWSLKAMTWANAEGLITGNSTMTFDPSGNASRAQVATILMRYCENIVK